MVADSPQKEQGRSAWGTAFEDFEGRHCYSSPCLFLCLSPCPSHCIVGAFDDKWGHTTDHLYTPTHHSIPKVSETNSATDSAVAGGLANSEEGDEYLGNFPSSFPFPPFVSEFGPHP